MIINIMVCFKVIIISCCFCKHRYLLNLIRFMLSNIKTNHLLWALGVCARVINRNHRLWCWGHCRRKCEASGSVMVEDASTTSYIFSRHIFINLYEESIFCRIRCLFFHGPAGSICQKCINLAPIFRQ